jgi:predicted DNA-binding transcriptional regulator YafY
LIGHCRLRVDYRDFLTDRIQQLVNTEKFFQKPNLLTLQAYIGHLRVQEDLEETMVWAHPGTAVFMQKQKYSWRFISEETQGKYVHMNV